MDTNNHHRKSIRLKGYDYREFGAYFITICAQEKQCLFGSVADGKVVYSSIGEVINQCWLDLPKHFGFLRLDSFVVMPNHIHGILIIDCNRTTCRGEASAREVNNDLISLSADASPLQPCGTLPGSICAVIQNFKSITARKVNQQSPSKIKLWQRNYYEHVIRDEQSLDGIRQYILANPWNWQRDDYYVSND